MIGNSACARMDVLIIFALSVFLTPPQMPASAMTNTILDIELKRVLVLTNLKLQQCYNVRPADQQMGMGQGALLQRPHAQCFGRRV